MERVVGGGVIDVLFCCAAHAYEFMTVDAATSCPFQSVQLPEPIMASARCLSGARVSL